MSDYLPRSAWNARPREHDPGRLEESDVVGLAFHWPGTTSTRPLSRDAVPRALRSWQDYHMDGHGWSDIAYQVAVDQWGRKWLLRGLGNRSAANGDEVVNGRYGAVLLVLVKGEEPSPEMVEAVREVVVDQRRMFRRSRRLVGHGEIRPGGGTDCPGGPTRAALRAGSFEPGNLGRDVLDMDEDKLRSIIREELDRVAYEDRDQPRVRRSLSGVLLSIDEKVGRLLREKR